MAKPVITTRIDKLGEWEYRAYLKIVDNDGSLEAAHITGTRTKAGEYLRLELTEYCDMMNLNISDYDIAV